ncbi:hypothetical protein AGABI1DRAFT_75664 [Agaricus bisporus var. burnettii JB137-S8]|uniref:DUF3533 domain-containing protein n=1 Tax=Agaricus bisporus var. burnettii (strain JB137-S8 / ATCC MYA-4627 / FGSC 10392) TaxID=597362 RepID=K5X4U3_AGABU|nr:uncharacterized protein AGABI1DRAFT_75664 [Agaricus bisporus var. burnettii JB137-S8]EKM78188.1 hypothetical protein AGABI1DRAFT_75664 [Agaricus bisporus var. burnettii JB137-S8]
MAAARKQYLKIMFGGVVVLTLIIFMIFSILWGAYFRTPSYNLTGWIIDFDGSTVGQAVVDGLTQPGIPSKIDWSVLQAEQFPDGIAGVSHAVAEHQTWVAVTVNSGASDRLTTSINSPNATYDGSEAISVFTVEARNENAFRIIIRPSVETILSMISARFGLQVARSLSDSPAVSQLLATSPQTVTTPISYQLVNLRPFSQPLASLVIFTGLIFMIILTFFIAARSVIGNGAREATNIHRLLRYRSLLALRFTTIFTAYFFLSLFYSLLSLAFQLDVNEKFGKSSFLVLWMMDYTGMLALGLALESMLTLVGIKFLPMFLLLWIMSNVSVVAFPIEVLPIIYRYGYAAPCYCISKIARTIIFGTKNQVGYYFGILIAWVAISCLTLTLFQFLARRRDVRANQQGPPPTEKVEA